MSTIKVNQIQNKFGGTTSTIEQIYQGRARVWWYYKQRNNIGIQNSYRVSSVTDVSTGAYKVNFADTLSNPCGLSGASYNNDAFDNDYSDVTNIYAANTYAEVLTVNFHSPNAASGRHDCNFNYGFIFCDV